MEGLGSFGELGVQGSLSGPLGKRIVLLVSKTIITVGSLGE